MDKEIAGVFFVLAKTDKHKAFQLAFDTYWLPLFKGARKKVMDTDLAKDLVQETFIVFLNKIDGLDEQDNLPAYLNGILRNKILQLFEKDKVRIHHANAFSSNVAVADHNSQNILLHKELNAMINNEVSSMPPRMQTIYNMKKEDDLSIKQIATDLCLSEQTIKNQLQMAYQRLKSRLSTYHSPLAAIALSIILPNFW